MNTIRRLSTIIVVMMGLIGCQQETFTSDNTIKDLGSEIELTMSASMSDVVIPTRSLTDSDEKAITRLDVLVFKSDDTFAYTVQANSPTVTGGTLSYTARLKKSIANERYKLVLLANLADAPVIVEGITKEAALASITFTPATDWAAGTKIPMWADYPTASVVSTSTTGSSFGATTLIRSLARVNVTNNAFSTFALSKVHVYNSTNKARVAPVLTNYDAGNTKVTAPSLAVGAATNAVYSKAAQSNKVEREIYIGESEDKPVGDASAVCLVFEGLFGGKTNFYRVDMVGADGKTVLDILRNHTYNVNITKVAGSGYSTKEDAFASIPINITIEIKVWDDASMNDIITDGQYSLVVDKGSVTVDGTSGTGKIIYSTNYPNVVTAVSSDSWITNITVGTTDPKTITFSFAENTAIMRKGSITITAGRIKKQINITQVEKAVYVGMFGGQLIGNDQDGWAFARPLYVQTTNEMQGTTETFMWAQFKDDHSVLAGSQTDGRLNTWNLNTGSEGSLTGLPAVNLCFGKNSVTERATKNDLKWYLPAYDQLMAILVTSEGSGTLWAPYAYWSSSEGVSAGYGSYVTFNNSSYRSGNMDKNTANRVRCVRELKQ